MSHSKRASPRQPRPLPRGDSVFTPGASAARRAVERRAAAPLLFLHQLPIWVPPVVMVALLVIGLTMRGVAGAAALFAVAMVLALLGYLSWPQLTVRGRLGRILAICAVLALAGWQVAR